MTNDETEESSLYWMVLHTNCTKISFSDDYPGVVFSVDENCFQEVMNSREEALVQDSSITNLGKKKLKAEKKCTQDW